MPFDIFRIHTQTHRPYPFKKRKIDLRKHILVFSPNFESIKLWWKQTCVLNSFLGADEGDARVILLFILHSVEKRYSVDFFLVLLRICVLYVSSFFFFFLEKRRKMWNTFALILQWLNTKQTSDHVEERRMKKKLKTKRTKCYFMPNKNRDRSSKKTRNSKPSTTIYCYLYVCCP